jgi:hypothetical protein
VAGRRPLATELATRADVAICGAVSWSGLEFLYLSSVNEVDAFPQEA